MSRRRLSSDLHIPKLVPSPNDYERSSCLRSQPHALSSWSAVTRCTVSLACIAEWANPVNEGKGRGTGRVWLDEPRQLNPAPDPSWSRDPLCP
jgi:hypothetical protein